MHFLLKNNFKFFFVGFGVGRSVGSIGSRLSKQALPAVSDMGDGFELTVLEEGTNFTVGVCVLGLSGLREGHPIEGCVLCSAGADFTPIVTHGNPRVQGSHPNVEIRKHALVR